MEITNQVFDRIFKRIFSLSDAAIILLINGLFDTDHSLAAVLYTITVNQQTLLWNTGLRIFLLLSPESITIILRHR